VLIHWSFRRDCCD